MNKLLFTITLGLLLGNSSFAQQRDTIHSQALKNDLVYDTINQSGKHHKHLRDSLRGQYRSRRSDSLRGQYRSHRSDSLRNKYRNHRSDSLGKKNRNHRSDSSFRRKAGISKGNYWQESHQHRNGKRLQHSLNLTAEQQVAVSKINKEFRLKADSLSRNNSMTVESRKAAKQALMADRKKQFISLLTPEQQKKFAELQRQKTTKEKQRVKNVDTTSTATLQNTYWKLSHVNNKPLVTPGNTREIHIMFSSDGKSFKGFAGCNGLGGDYTTGEKQTININAISTQMYCDRMEAENFLTNAIRKANRYSIKGEKLLLFENKKLLASFDSVYF
jgi:heat shock protein HslJ